MFKWDTVKPNVDNEITIIVKQQQSLLIYGGDETRHQWDGKIKKRRVKLCSHNMSEGFKK
jgi:hypothetical protein